MPEIVVKSVTKALICQISAMALDRTFYCLLLLDVFKWYMFFVGGRYKNEPKSKIIPLTEIN